MAESSILREYLVALGFDVKSDEYRKFTAALDNVTRGVTVLGAALAVGTAAVDTLVKKTSAHFADLYYSGQRVGDSVQNLEAWRVGAQQAGLTTEKATGTIEAFAQAIRLSPGLGGILKGFGIDTTQSKVNQLVELVNKLRTMNPAVAAQYGNMFGIDPDTLLLLEQKLPAVVAGMDAYRDKLKKSGVDADKLAEKSRAMDLAFKNFDNDIGNLAARLEDDFMPAATKVLDWADKAVVKFNQLDKATDGWAGRIAGVAATVGSFFGLRSVFRSVKGFFGKGAAEGAGEAAAGAGEGGAAAAEAAGAGAAATGLGYSIAAVAAPVAAFLLGMKPTATQTDEFERAEAAKFRASHGKLDPSRAEQSAGLVDLLRQLERSGDSAVSKAQGTGHGGAIGRFQIMPDTARRLGFDPARLTDPIYSAEVAKAAVKDIFGQGARTLDEVLVGYNSSPKFLRKFVASGDNANVLLPETQKYLAHAHRLLGQNGGLLDEIEKSRIFSGGGSGIRDTRIAGAGATTINNDIKNEFHIAGAPSPKETADEVIKQQSRVYGDAVRNTQGAVQ